MKFHKTKWNDNEQENKRTEGGYALRTMHVICVYKCRNVYGRANVK